MKNLQLSVNDPDLEFGITRALVFKNFRRSEENLYVENLVSLDTSDLTIGDSLYINWFD